MTRKVKAFLHSLVTSIVPQNTYYAHILKQKIIRSIAYYLIVLIIISGISVGIIFLQFTRNNSEKLNKCLQYSLKTIPSDFSLRIENGLMSTNQTMPLLIWFNCEDKINLLGVIDERSTRNDIASYNAQALASGTELTLRYKSYLFEFPYKKYVTTLNADKTVIADYMNRAVSIINKSMPLVSFFVILLTPLTLFLLNVSFLLMSSLFVLLFFKTMKRHYAYRTIFHVGLHSSTLPMLVSLLFLLFPIHITSSLILFFFLIFVFQLVGVYEAHYSEHLAHHK